MKLFKKAANWFLKEPVAVLTGAVGGGITWLFSHFSWWHVSDTEHNTITSAVVIVMSLIARALVTPTKKSTSNTQ